MKLKQHKKIGKTCAVCGKAINVYLYKGGKYRGGHYFGKIPLHTKKALDEASKAGTRKVKMGDMVWDVMKKETKPYKHVEYWECPKCYWRN